MAVNLDSAFWFRFPKLRLLGCVDVRLVDHPPPGHPLRHLHISKPHIYLQSPERLSVFLSLFGDGRREKKTLYIAPPTISLCQNPFRDQWIRFYAETRRDGFTWKLIAPSTIDPEHAWALWVEDDEIGVVEKRLVNWALEVYFAVALSMVPARLGPRVSPDLRHLKALLKPTRAPPTLPIEIWEIIIEFAIDVPEYFGTDCRAEDFPHFIAYHRIHDVNISPQDPYRRSEAVVIRLRLVSRTWNQVLKRHSKRWQFPSDRKRPLYPRTRRIDIALPSESHIVKSHGADSELESLGFSSLPNISILAILDYAVQPSTVESRIDELCQSRPEFLANVKSLAYATPGTQIPPNALSRLSTSFTSLGSLILEGHSVGGNLFLPQLHTLALTTQVTILAGWQCPNLRNFSLSAKSSAPDLSIVVPSHFNNGLQALIVQPWRVELDSSFWARYPNLQLIGCSMILVEDGPPPSHPLRHIYIGKPAYHMSPRQLSSLFGRMVREGRARRTLYLHPPKPRAVSHENWPEWFRFYEECRASGIVWRPISPAVDPDTAWAPLMKNDWLMDLEISCVEWALELAISFSLAIVYYVIPTVTLGPIKELWRLWEIALVVSAFFIYWFAVHASSDIPPSS
ncbi:hypothetical protein FRC17_001102 [Serendipita sp. 399]|nr:hypothetical protein FRC17_001102 [Serendipita sp. 399]